MKLVVGLGNYPKEYENTRHNVGFIVLEEYLKTNNLTFDKTSKKAIYTIHNNTIYCEPQTFMNLSGECVIELVNFYKINVEDILIIYDDIDTELGEFRIKKNGSGGGHNGMKNIILKLGTQDIKKIRVGISKPINKDIILSDWVLGKFNKNDKDIIINLAKEKINKIIDDFSNNKIAI